MHWREDIFGKIRGRVCEDSLVSSTFVEAITFQRVCKNRMRIWKQFFFSLSSLLNLARDRIAREKTICVWLLSLASLEPGWAWASKCQSDKDQAWQTDRHRSFVIPCVILSLASPIFAGLKSSEMMGEGVLGVNVRLCNSSKCHNSSNVDDEHYSDGLWELSLLSCVLCGGVAMETQNTSTSSPPKDMRFTQKEKQVVFLGSEVTKCEVTFRNKI